MTLPVQDNNNSKHSNSVAAIIGAGPAGLACARVLKQLGIAFEVFEKHDNVGGIWDRSNPGSPMYRSAHFISSKTLSGHSGYPMPDDYPDYPSNTQILNYIESFARAYSLTEHIHFNHNVVAAEPVNEGWLVSTSANGETQQRQFRWLICANGTNWFPNRPSIVGEEEFSGELIHSVDYHDIEQIKGKRVLVVGAGNSGVDIACDAAFSASEAYISLRRGYHFVPKHIFGMPADVFGQQSKWLPMQIQQAVFGTLLRLLEGDLTKLGLQKPDHKILSSHPILNSQILHYLQHGDLKAKPDIRKLDAQGAVFEDGSHVDLDMIILATGYQWRAPYLPEGIFQVQNNRPQTFMKVFNPQHPSLFINGFIETDGGAYKLFDEMAWMIGNTILAQRDKPDLAKRIQQYIEGPEPELGGQVNYVKSDRHTGYTNSRAYRKAMHEFNKRMNLKSVEQALQGA